MITVGIVTYNRLDCLTRIVDYYLSSEYVSNIVVLDNCSTDGTSQYLSQLNESKIRVFSSNNNTGGAGGFNFLFNYFKNHLCTDWCFVSDDDVMPSSDIFDVFFSRSRELDVYQATRFETDGTMRVQQIIQPGFNYLTLPKLDCASNKKIIPIDLFPFEAVFINRRVIIDLPPPPKEYFLFWDDTEFAMNVKSRGFFVCQDFDLKANRMLPVLSGTSNLKFYCYWRNRLEFESKYFSKLFLTYSYILLLKSFFSAVLNRRLTISLLPFYICKDFFNSNRNFLLRLTSK